jgi:capsular polysaccharide biosynthesis protein
MNEILVKSLTVHRSKPENLADSDLKFFEQELERLIPTVELFHFENVYMFPSGMTFKKFRVVPESLPSKDWIPKFSWKYLLKKFISQKIKKAEIDKIYILAHDEWSYYYFHWLTDVLPRIFLLKDRLDDLVLLLPENFNEDYQLSALDIFGIKNIYRISSGSIVKIEKLLIPGHLAPTGNFIPGVMKNLRGFIFNKMKDKLSFSIGDKIYISRSKAKMRKVLNEDEVTDFLKKRGFAILNFEDYSFYEQMAIAYHAKVIISIHGAGLTNMMFMEAGSVLELRKESDGNNNCYFALANALDLKYYYQFCKMKKGNPGDEADIVVDLNTLERNIDLISIN